MEGTLIWIMIVTSLMEYSTKMGSNNVMSKSYNFGKGFYGTNNSF
jgi:hypothetical protein